MYTTDRLEKVLFSSTTFDADNIPSGSRLDEVTWCPLVLDAWECLRTFAEARRQSLDGATCYGHNSRDFSYSQDYGSDTIVTLYP